MIIKATQEKRNLLIAYVCNEDDYMTHGSIMKSFDDFPSISEIEKEILGENENYKDICITNIVEFNNEDFKKLTNE